MTIKLFILVSMMVLVLFVHGKSLIYPTPIPLLPQNHIPHAKIPNEYHILGSYLKDNVRTGERVLTLPWAKASYVVYKWWPYLHMPDIVNRITYLPVIGTDSSHRELFSEIIKLNDQPDRVDNLNLIENELKLTSVRYIIVHHDYTEDGPMAHGANATGITRVFMNEAKTGGDFELVLGNEYFVLFRYLGLRGMSVQRGTPSVPSYPE